MWPSWRDGVVRDAETWLSCFEGDPTSIYLGGGTPSLIPDPILESLLGALPRAAEVTLEANPGDVDTGGLKRWHDLGVTRLSLGIQTFDERFAHVLNRAHTVAQSRRLVQMVKEAGFGSWSVDVIFGLPDQAMGDFSRDLQAILDAEPPHVSLYGLTVEEGTPLQRAVARGKLLPADDEVWWQMYDHAVSVLQDGGWQRYEVSNFARPDNRSRHNEDVWLGGTYAGLGPGAHGFLPNGRRTVMTADPAAWLERSVATEELPTAEQAAIDGVLTCMRHEAGLDLSRLSSATGLRPSPTSIDHLAANGLIVRRGQAIALSDRGFAVADGVIAQLCRTLVPS